MPGSGKQYLLKGPNPRFCGGFGRRMKRDMFRNLNRFAYFAAINLCYYRKCGFFGENCINFTG